MTGEAIISRREMVDAMTQQYNADLVEQCSQHWKNVDLATVDQGDMEVKGGVVDFHLIEFCLTGSHAMECEYPQEAGDHHHDPILPGRVSYVQSGVPVWLSCVGSAKFQQLYIDDGVFRAVAAAIAPGDPDRVEPLGFQGLFEPDLARIVRQLREEARQPSAGDEFYADLLVQQIATIILRRRLNGQARAPFAGRLSKEQLALVFDHLEANIADPGGLGVLADLTDVDQFSFTRAFKASTGETPHQYLIQRRVETACEDLANTNNSIADIAYACGFSSQAHMTTVFGKHLGVTPAAYRREVRG